MICPKCGSAINSVLETRSLHDGGVARRTRLCSNCRCRFSTYEIQGAIWPTVLRWAVRGSLAQQTNRSERRQRDAEIVRRIKLGEKRYLLAEEFDVSVSTISYISARGGIPKRSVAIRSPT